MPAMEIITGNVTAPGATETALTMSAGDSLSVRNCAAETNIRLLDMWAFSQGAGILKVRSAKMHDNVQGIRYRTIVADNRPLLPSKVGQKLYPQDDLIVTLSGSAVAGDIEVASLLLYYADLPGVQQRLITPEEALTKAVNAMTQEVTLTAGAGGGYTGQAVLNSTFDLLKANTDYAIVGYMCNAPAGSIGIRGSDTGNLRIGGPGLSTERNDTRTWFIDLSNNHSLPLVPVFNSANKFGIFCDVAQNENAAAVIVNFSLLQLGA